MPPMFLDLRDQWPPVPPSNPVPAPGQPSRTRRGERIVGLIVAINLGLLLLAPIVGSSVMQALLSLAHSLQH
jgi:hypothetical protein